MRDRFPHWQEGQASLLDGSTAAKPSSDPLADAEAALVTLGYKPTEASRMLSGLDKTLPTEALIKTALSRQLAG